MSDIDFIQGGIISAADFTSAIPPVQIASFNIPQQNATPLAGVVRNGKGDFTVNLPDGGIDIAQRVVIPAAAGLGIAHYDRAGSTDSTLHILVFDNANAALDAEVGVIVVRTAVS